MKVVLQDGIKDCGICCLLSIIRFYGGDVSKEYLREITNTTKDGVSFYNLIEGAKKIGFEAIGVTGKLENINVNNLPCIVHCIVNKSYKHFVVLYQIQEKKQQVILMDPAKGKKTISFAEFNLLTSSNYLLLKPTKKIPLIRRKNKIVKSLTNLIKKNKLLLFQLIFLTFCYFILNIITSFHFKFLLEYSIQYNISNNILIISYLIITLYALKNINFFLRNILYLKWNSIFDYETTSLTYKQILLLPYLYYKSRTTGEVVSRIKDLSTVRTYISNFFCVLTTEGVSFLIFLGIMYKVNKKLTTKLCILFFLLGIFILSLNRRKKKFVRRISSKQDIIHSYLIQGISNVDTMKGFHLEKRMIDKFNLNYKSFQEEVYQYNRLLEIQTFIKNNVNDITTCFIYGIGAYFVINKKMSLGNLLLFQTFFLYYKNSFYAILYLLEEYSAYKVAKERIEDLFMIHEEQFDNHYYYLGYQCKGNIEYRNLSYKVGNKILLNNINLMIHSGEKILLCGESGSGKSTLLKMLLRYIEVEYGHIKIENIDINHYHLENIRSHITYVSNNEYLFTDTLRNNICMYKEKDEKEFETVCKICLVEDILKNKIAGYDTLIEENGFNLSNGERQRIILARSILRNSSIYIFDEALASIDINREKKILTNIFSYLQDKTIIVISHRYNNKKIFNRVLKLENGMIHESKAI